MSPDIPSREFRTEKREVLVSSAYSNLDLNIPSNFIVGANSQSMLLLELSSCAFSIDKAQITPIKVVAIRIMCYCLNEK